MIRRLKKIFKFFSIIIIFLFVCFILSRGKIYSKEDLKYGITFSKKQAESLGFEWKKVYLAVLDDLGAKKIRLPAYWDQVELDGGKFFWDDMDWQVSEAQKREAEIILAVGGRLPRWPECHFPGWTKDFSKEDREQKILAYIEETVKRYNGNKAIVAWQVENEPFLSHFGDCPELDKNFLDKEIGLVKKLDSRPIVITDSGELSTWIPAFRRANIFGTTMYLDTYSSHLKTYIHYPIKPGFFRFKKNVASLFAKPEKSVVIELQAEPWAPVPYQNASQEDRDRTMNLEKFKKIIDFSSKTGFNEFYLWGVEWWYWEKEVNNNPAVWEEAKKLFK
jgi:hypothetical protein